MNKTAGAIFLVVTVALLAINLAPIRRGEKLVCVADTGKHPKRAIVVGLPFGFYQSASAGSDCILQADEPAEVGVKPKNTIFTSASLWFDLIIAGIIVLGAYDLLGQKKAA
jgi:hypothetical protein